MSLVRLHFLYDPGLPNFYGKGSYRPEPALNTLSLYLVAVLEATPRTVTAVGCGRVRAGSWGCVRTTVDPSSVVLRGSQMPEVHRPPDEQGTVVGCERASTLGLGIPEVHRPPDEQDTTVGCGRVRTGNWGCVRTTVVPSYVVFSGLGLPEVHRPLDEQGNAVGSGRVRTGNWGCVRTTVVPSYVVFSGLGLPEVNRPPDEQGTAVGCERVRTGIPEVHHTPDEQDTTVGCGRVSAEGWGSVTTTVGRSSVV
ncbi:hypothetical protein FIBSPDRAFT_895649 [Athelia psychrophila]|uniref:Uncharacterized protein n=1 Tax=Athelia psychrophila TaxID=1759441 RepID=A0A166EDI1_9AGAM|nr:hypothetical protein FIBSPDRAFT_895649 [Fibularhizoctonia sp. CBS 109695]